jgi:hypothetical protein
MMTPAKRIELAEQRADFDAGRRRDERAVNVLGEDGGGTPEAKMAIPCSRRQSSSGGSISSRGRRDLPLVVEPCRDLTKG